MGLVAVILVPACTLTADLPIEPLLCIQCNLSRLGVDEISYTALREWLQPIGSLEDIHAAESAYLQRAVDDNDHHQGSPLINSYKLRAVPVQHGIQSQAAAARQSN